MATPKSKPESVDYLTLLGYIKELGIKLYNTDQVDCNYEFLGSGGSMTVYRGNLIENQDGTDSNRIPVAVKVPNVKDMGRDAKAFSVLADVRQELRMMKHFESHPNIINLYGVIFQDLVPVVIVELAEDCITEYLAKMKDKRTPVNWETKARFCCEVVDGLQALHAAEIVHGDLKGDNILLFSDHEDKLVAKITDFGYSATKASIERGVKTGGSLHFLAPECTKYAPTNIRDYENNPLKDNYAFGLYVWQVAKDGEIPYDEMDEDEIHTIKNTDTKLEGLMKELKEDTPQYFKDVITAMTKYIPEERKDLTKVREMMKLIDISYSMAKNNFELYAKELPHDIAKADLSSIEFMSISLSLKTKIFCSYKKAAKNGDANAMFMLAICYNTGFGVEIDKEKTLEWCSKAAEAGSLDAISNITRNYKLREIPVEPSVAFPWYLKAAEEGHHILGLQISNCYFDGYGVKKDEMKLLTWLTNYMKYMKKMDVNTMNIDESIAIDETSLYRASRLGNVEGVRFLLEQGNVDISERNKEGLTALHIAAQYGHIEIVKLLMASLEIDTNEKAMFNNELLSLAAGRGHIEVVRLIADETSITTLDFPLGGLGSSEARALAESLKMYTALTNLNLQFNHIADKGACSLAEFLKQNSTIIQLELRSNGIGNEGSCALAECLKQNSTLTNLDLSCNEIGGKGAFALVECLKQNSTLRELDLMLNKIGDKGACALAECLKQNSTLTMLDLSSNEISNQGAYAFAVCLKQNSTLIKLILGVNNIDEDGACALAEGLKQNSTLTYLYLSDDKLSDIVKDRIKNCLKLNRKKANGPNKKTRKLFSNFNIIIFLLYSFISYCRYEGILPTTSFVVCYFLICGVHIIFV